MVYERRKRIAEEKGGKRKRKKINANTPIPRLTADQQDEISQEVKKKFLTQHSVLEKYYKHVSMHKHGNAEMQNKLLERIRNKLELLIEPESYDKVISKKCNTDLLNTLLSTSFLDRECT